MIRGRSCLCLLVLFTTTVGSDDWIRVGDVRVRLPLPRPSDSLLQRLRAKLILLNLNGSSFGSTHSPSDTNAIRSQFLFTVRTCSDTNATRYPQFQCCMDILVDTPGVALPVSVQSSFWFLDDTPEYTASLRCLLKALLTLYRGRHTLPPRVQLITSLLCTRTFRGSSYHYIQSLSQGRWPA